MNVRHLALALALVTTPIVAGCSSDDEPDNAAEARDPSNGKTISELDIVGDDRTTLEVGATTQLTATLRYSDGTTRDITREPGTVWNTSSPDDATVTSGLVTGVSTGTAEISATYNGIRKADTIAITD